MTVPEATPAATMLCPTCGAEVAAGESFCEACGTTLTLVDARSASAPAQSADDDLLDSPITLSRSVQEVQPAEPEDIGDTEDTIAINRPCLSCGGVVGVDGYCETCGTKAASLRDHYTEQPASWVAASCDRGIRHYRNEDATAIAADPIPGSRAVLVVCDGVSTSPDSDIASLAAARAARNVMVALQPAGLGVPASRAAALGRALEAAARRANEAVIASTGGGASDMAADPAGVSSCTFAAAIIEGDLVVFGNVGDSRVYWIPDADQLAVAQQLSLDDSVAQERMTLGVSREEAEHGPQAHAITRWLGRDAPEIAPHAGSVMLDAPGWVVVCSDGLWNYVSEADELQDLIARLSAQSAEPLTLAEALVRWACDQGGKDNISVALARH